MAVTTSCIQTNSLGSPLLRVNDVYASLLEGRQHTNLFWKSRRTCTESRKSHCYKPTSETDLNEDSDQTEYDQLITAQQNKSIQQIRKAANVRNSYRNYTPPQHRISLAARSTAGYRRQRMSSAVLERNSTFMQMQLPGVTEIGDKTSQAADRSQEKCFPTEGLLHY